MDRNWTRDRVCESVETAFRGRGFYGATHGEVERLLNYRVRAPSLSGQDWLMLLVHAECRAGRSSVEERRKAYGWSSGRFQRGWRRAADLIASELNVERMNRASFKSNEEAESRLLESGRLREVRPEKIRLTVEKRRPDNLI